MIPQLTFAGAIHATLAMFGIVAGLAQFLRPKRGAGHRARGYAFVYAMLVADAAALMMFQFTGRFNMLHVGAIANLLCVIAAVIPVLRNPRPSNWKYLHYYWMSWSYVGLMAGAATQLVVRTVHLAGRGQAWTVTAVMTILVTAIGFILIIRYRPTPDSQPVPHHEIQQDAAPS
jgi:uncharacterized membrane protein